MCRMTLHFCGTIIRCTERFHNIKNRRLMATAIFCQRVLRLHLRSGFKRGSILARSLHIRSEVDPEDLDDSYGELQPKEGPELPYRLYYNPASYCQISYVRTALRESEQDEDKPCMSTVTPCYWRQGNKHRVISSRHFSSCDNTLLDSAFNNSPETEHVCRRPSPPVIWFDARAFLKCRPEYSFTSLNFTERPSSTPFDKSCALLQKVIFLKGSMKPSDISRIIRELSFVDQDKAELVINDRRFVMLLKYSVENLPLYSVCQLLEIVQAFVWLDIPSTHSVLTVYESELNCRADQMTLHQLLFASDLWRCIGKKVPQFLKSLYASVPLYVGQIRTPELVQLLYIMGEGRHCPTHLIQPIEQLLMHHLHDLHPEEVGTVCLGLFKSQTSLSRGAVIHIVDKAQSLVENMSDFALVNVMKYLRFSYLYHKDWFDSMEKEVPKRADRMGIQGLMHLLLACSSLKHCSDSILMGIAERVPSMISHSRSKDSCKLLWAFGTLGFHPDKSPSLYPGLIEGLRQRKEEFNHYPQHLLTGLLGLAFVSTFPEDLVALALSPEFVSLALNTTQLELKKDLHTLDGAVELELPNWTGPRLSSKIKEEASDMMWKFAGSEVCQKEEIVEAEKCLKTLLGGKEYVCKRMILPHTRSIDLEVHLDSKGQPIPVVVPCNQKAYAESPSVTLTDNLVAELVNSKSTKLSPKVEHSSICKVEPAVIDEFTEMLTKGRPCKENNGPAKLAIQVCNRNYYCLNSGQLMGLHAMKRRHLKLAGYKVIELHHEEWFPLLRKSKRERLVYLHGKVFSQ